jgi:AcrR family transcriptional regulator
MRRETSTKADRRRDPRLREDTSTTRARILDACRVLFNERGPAEVTTAEIADMVGISEGNLHYHFRRKQEIVTALFELFREQLEKTPDGEEVMGPPGSRRRYLSHWFNLMWEWRFLHYANVYRMVPGLRPGLRDWANTMQAKVRVTLEALRRAGELEATDAEIDRLVVNAWIVGTYWIDYLRVHHAPEPITRDQLRWGFAQVEALFTPYMTRAAVGLREAG